MMKSHDINIFVVPFEKICEFLGEVGIDFNWGEKDREKAVVAWEKYRKLSSKVRMVIGYKMV